MANSILVHSGLLLRVLLEDGIEILVRDVAKTFSCKKPKALKFERRTGTLPRRTEDEFFSRRVLLSPSAPLSLASAPAAASASR